MAEENQLWPGIKAVCDVAWRVEGVLQKGFPDTLVVVDHKYMTLEMKDVRYGSPLGLLPEQIAWCRKAGRAQAPHFIIWIFRDYASKVKPRVWLLSLTHLHNMFPDEHHFTRALKEDTRLPEDPTRWAAERQGSPGIGCTLGYLEKGAGHFGLALRGSLLCRV